MLYCLNHNCDANLRYIESIHNMRKPVISNEISPKFDGVPTTDFLPVYEIRQKCMYVSYISRFLVSSRPEIESSSPGEFHPQALTERYVTVSRHTAPANLALETSRSQADAVRNPVPPSCLVDHHLLRAGSSPSLQSHYRTFNTTTG